MPSPFPGMDPYLERRTLWPDVHHNLIVAIQDALVPQVAPAYYVAIEQRVTMLAAEPQTRITRSGAAVIPTWATGGAAGGGVALAAPSATTAMRVTLPSYEAIREGYLEIRDVEHHVVVTAIAVLSPTSKVHHEGRQEYEKKRREVLCSVTNRIEIDLLRAGEPMAMEPMPTSDYRIMVRRGWERPGASLFAVNLRQLIPAVPVPLRWGEQEATLSLGEMLPRMDDRARYDLRIDYHRPPPEPPLSPEDAAWVQELLRDRTSRGAPAPDDASGGGAAPAAG